MYFFCFLLFIKKVKDIKKKKKSEVPEGVEWSRGQFSQVTEEESHLSLGKYFSVLVTLVFPRWECVHAGS